MGIFLQIIWILGGFLAPPILESKIHQLQIEAEERRLTLGLSFAGLVDDAALIQAERELLGSKQLKLDRVTVRQIPPGCIFRRVL